MIERIYWIVSSQRNVKRVFRKILEGHAQQQKFVRWTQPLFPLTLFTSGLLRVKCLGEGSGFNHFKYFENKKDDVNEFLHSNSLRYQILIWECKVFACFRRILPVTKFKAIIFKARKRQLLRIFCCQDISKNRLNSKIKSPLHLPTPVSPFCLSFWCN